MLICPPAEGQVCRQLEYLSAPLRFWAASSEGEVTWLKMIHIRKGFILRLIAYYGTVQLTNGKASILLILCRPFFMWVFIWAKRKLDN